MKESLKFFFLVMLTLACGWLLFALVCIGLVKLFKLLIP